MKRSSDDSATPQKRQSKNNNLEIGEPVEGVKG